MPRSGTTVTSVFFSVLLHVVAATLLFVSLNMATRTFRPAPTDVVQAVTIDSKEVEKELQKLQEIDQQKQREAERKLKEAEDQRKQEEKRLTEMKKQQEQEKLKREEEQKKLAQLKEQQKQLEEKKKREEAAKQAAEADRVKKEKEAAKAAAAERKRKEQEAAQVQQDQQLLRSIYSSIYNRVKNNFNISGLPPGLKCVISVRVIPGGDIVSASINRSSGNDIFDQRAQDAVLKAAPLPVPADAATLDRLKLRQFLFEFSP